MRQSRLVDVSSIESADVLKQERHFAAMPYADVPDFIKKLHTIQHRNRSPWIGIPDPDGGSHRRSDRR